LKLFLGENVNYLAKQKVAQNVPHFFWLLQLAKKITKGSKISPIDEKSPNQLILI
jgi:hypothetical protein